MAPGTSAKRPALAARRAPIAGHAGSTSRVWPGRSGSRRYRKTTAGHVRTSLELSSPRRRPDPAYRDGPTADDAQSTVPASGLGACSRTPCTRDPRTLGHGARRRDHPDGTRYGRRPSAFPADPPIEPMTARPRGRWGPRPDRREGSSILAFVVEDRGADPQLDPVPIGDGTQEHPTAPGGFGVLGQGQRDAPG